MRKVILGVVIGIALSLQAVFGVLAYRHFKGPRIGDVNALVAALSSESDEFEIGQYGTRIGLGPGWSRLEVGETFGRNRFGNGDFQISVRESPGPLVIEDDFHYPLDTFTNGLETAGYHPLESDREFRVRDGVSICRQTVRAQVQGSTIVYEVCTVGRDNLNYFFLGWTVSGTANSVELKQKLHETVQSMQWPNANSGWGAAKQVATETFTAKCFTVELPLRKSVFTVDTEDLGDSFCHLTSYDAGMDIFLFVTEGYRTPHHVIGALSRKLTDDFTGLREVKREDVTVAGRSAVRVYNAAQGTSIVSTIVPLDSGRYLEARFLCECPLERRETYMLEVLDGLSISGGADDAFPVVEESPDEEGDVLAPPLRRLLESAEPVGHFSGRFGHARLLPDGSVRYTTGQMIEVLPPDGETAVLANLEWYYLRTAARSGETLLVTGQHGKVVRLESDGPTPTEIRAERLEDGPDKGFLLACRDGVGDGQEDTVLPYPHQLGRHRVEHHTEEGQTRILMQTAAPVTALSLSGDRRRLLVQTAEHWGCGAGDESAALHVVDLEVEADPKVMHWSQVTKVSPGGNGWLVNGRPTRDSAVGLYALRPTGDHELLIAGYVFQGVALSDESVLCTSTRTIPGDDTVPEGNTVLYRVPLQSIRTWGRACAPFNAAMIQQIAQTTCTELELDVHCPTVLATQSEFHRFLRRALAVSQRLCGCSLPVNPTLVDALLGDLAGTTELGDEAYLLLGAMLTESLLQQDAVWVDGKNRAMGRRGASRRQMVQDPFSYAVVPGNVLMSTLYDSEGWHAPATRVPEIADGRTIIVGPDPDTIFDELRNRRDAALTRVLGQQDAGAALTFLTRHAKNVHLRRHVYGEMRAWPDRDAVMETITGMLRGEHAAPVDYRFWLGLRMKQIDSGDMPPGWMDDCRDAIRRAPDEAVFYYLLGQGYERTSGERALEKAKACYRKTTALTWGAVREKAEAALERLAPAPGEDDRDG